MSAVASTAEYVPAAPALELVGLSPAELAEKEMYRWMLWFGLPSLVAAIFVAAVFATGSMWWIGGAIAGVQAPSLSQETTRGGGANETVTPVSRSGRKRVAAVRPPLDRSGWVQQPP